MKLCKHCVHYEDVDGKAYNALCHRPPERREDSTSVINGVKTGNWETLPNPCTAASQRFGNITNSNSRWGWHNFGPCGSSEARYYEHDFSSFTEEEKEEAEKEQAIETLRKQAEIDALTARCFPVQSFFLNVLKKIKRCW